MFSPKAVFFTLFLLVVNALAVRLQYYVTYQGGMHSHTTRAAGEITDAEARAITANIGTASNGQYQARMGRRGILTVSNINVAPSQAAANTMIQDIAAVVARIRRPAPAAPPQQHTGGSNQPPPPPPSGGAGTKKKGGLGAKIKAIFGFGKKKSASRRDILAARAAKIARRRAAYAAGNYH